MNDYEVKKKGNFIQEIPNQVKNVIKNVIK